MIIASVFTSSFVLHALTAARTVTFSDSGDFLMAISTVGNCHSPGYPLYLMTVKLFSWLVPVGSLAFRASLYSGIFASLTACLIYWIVYQVTSSRLGGVTGALVYCFSYTFWYQTVIPETYGLTTFLMALLIVLIFRWERLLKEGRSRRADNTLALFAFCYGLALANHYSVVFFFPAFLIFALDTSWRDVVAPRNILRMAVFFALGLLPYVYEPVAAFRGPAYNYGDPSTLTRWYQHVTLYYLRGGLFGYPYRLFPRRLWRYFGTLNREFPYFAWLGGLGVAGSLIKRDRKRGLFLLLLLPLSLLPVMTYNQIEPVLRAHFYYPSYLIFAIFIGLGAAWLAKASSYLAGRWNRLVEVTAATLVGMIVLACPVAAAIVHYDKADKSNYCYAYDMARNMLETAERDAVILVDSDNAYFPTRYLKVVEKIRPDVRLANVQSAGVPGFEGLDLLTKVTKGYRAGSSDDRLVQMVEKNFRELPVYSADPLSARQEWNKLWQGFLLRVLPKDIATVKTGGTIRTGMRGSGVPFRRLDTDAREALLLPDALKANAESGRNRTAAAAGIYERIIPSFEKGVYVPTLYSCGTYSSLNEIWGQALNRLGEFKKTVRFLPPGKTINPDYYSPTLASALEKTGNYSGALEELEGCLIVQRANASLLVTKGEIQLRLGEYDSAADALEEATRIEPSNAGSRYLYGLALARIAREKEAAEQFNQALKLEPNGPFAPGARRQLDLLQKR